MPSLTTCPHCDAKLRSRHQAYCEYCGGALPAPEPTTSGERRADDLARRFEELRRHPDLPELLRHNPSGQGLVLQSGCGVAFMVVFVVIALAITGVFAGVGGMAAGPFGSLFGVVPLLMAGIGVVGLVIAVKRLKAVSLSPLRRVPAVVLGKRTHVSGGGDSSQTSTQHYVTLETESGQRVECHVSGRVSGLLKEGDLGIAFLKARHLLDFRRLRV